MNACLINYIDTIISNLSVQYYDTYSYRINQKYSNICIQIILFVFRIFLNKINLRDYDYFLNVLIFVENNL